MQASRRRTSSGSADHHAVAVGPSSELPEAPALKLTFGESVEQATTTRSGSPTSQLVSTSANDAHKSGVHIPDVDGDSTHGNGHEQQSKALASNIVAGSSRKRKREPGTDILPLNSLVSPTPAADELTPSPAYHRIKRIRLIHRIPYTHPAQIPDLPQHGGQLGTFLDSYIDLTDNGEALIGPTEEILARVALREREEADLRSRIDTFRQAGRLPPEDHVPGTKYDEAVLLDGGAGAWGTVVRHVVALRGSQSLPQRTSVSVAKLLSDHFIVQKQREMAEEQRLRTLAKSTIENIVHEWRKAVYHIQQRQEETRRSRQQLDELLEKTSAVLGFQKADLGRTAMSTLDVEGNEPGGGSVRESEDSIGARSQVAAEDMDVVEDDASMDHEDGDGPRNRTLNDNGEWTSHSISRKVVLDESDIEDTTGMPLQRGRSSKPITSDVVMAEQPSVGVASATDGATDATTAQGEQIATDNPDTIEIGPDDETDDLPLHLHGFATAPVDWDPATRVTAPLLLRGHLRAYQQYGLEWLASLHTNNLDGILADETGLGKTIQTIALLAHLACDRGIWGPHLIFVPTSVLLHWETEFKKFLPGFKVLAYHGDAKRREGLRVGWTNYWSFNVCLTSYALAGRDAQLFKRKSWYYMVLDEANLLKNFTSQRWNTLLTLRARRRLLLTGTPLQDNPAEQWSLLRFLMAGNDFANLKEFGARFANQLENAAGQSSKMDTETRERVQKLHAILRPYLLRRLKADVEHELPQKHEHLVLCRLSTRQRYLHDTFMSQAQTCAALDSGVYQKIANVLMQLRKVCNHPDLFEERQTVSPFVMTRGAMADFEISELLVRRRLLVDADEVEGVDLDLLGVQWLSGEMRGVSVFAAHATAELDASHLLCNAEDLDVGPEPEHDLRTITGLQLHDAWKKQAENRDARMHLAYVNHLKCARKLVTAVMDLERTVRVLPKLQPLEFMDEPCHRRAYWTLPTRASSMVQSARSRAESLASAFRHFLCAIPAAVVSAVGRHILGFPAKFTLPNYTLDTLPFDAAFHHTAGLLALSSPEARLVQYDCGKLQELHRILQRQHAGGHRVLIFTQMTRMLDILEVFLSLHGWRYLRSDGRTKIEDRQYITELFNQDKRVFVLIASSRSGRVGITLTGVDTVIFFDSDFSPHINKQCEDHARRIGQIRDVHIYRLISAHTVEEDILRKANRKHQLDELVIQQGGFDWRKILLEADEGLLGKALEWEEEEQDAHARALVTCEEAMWNGEDDEDDEDYDGNDAQQLSAGSGMTSNGKRPASDKDLETGICGHGHGDHCVKDPEIDGRRTIADYMLETVQRDWEFFATMTMPVPRVVVPY